MSEAAAAAPAAPVPGVPPAAPPTSPAPAAKVDAAPPIPAPAESSNKPMLTPEQMARASAALSKQEIALREKQRQSAAQRDALQKQVDEAKADREWKARVLSLAKQNPDDALKELGLDYATLTKARITANPEAPLKQSELDRRLKEMEAKFAAEREAERKALDEANKQREAQAQQQTYEHWRKKASAVVESNAEKFDVLTATWSALPDAPPLDVAILETVERDYKQRMEAGEKDVKAITLDEAAERLRVAAEQYAERIAAAHAKKMAKVAATPAPAEKPAEPAGKTPPSAPAKDAAATEPKAEVKTPVDIPPRPVFDPAEDFQDYLLRFNEWERKYGTKKA